MTLFRGYASAYPSSSVDASDVPVFFEADNATKAGAKLMALLSATWGCSIEDLDVYNVFSESELLELYADSDQSHRDVALLGNGYESGRVIYLDAARPMLYVGPEQHRRLCKAMHALHRQQSATPACSAAALEGA